MAHYWLGFKFASLLILEMEIRCDLHECVFVCMHACVGAAGDSGCTDKASQQLRQPPTGTFNTTASLYGGERYGPPDVGIVGRGVNQRQLNSLQEDFREAGV